MVETWLTPDIHSSELFDPRYVVFRLDRNLTLSDKATGVGIVFAIKNKFRVTSLNKWNISSPNIESCWFQCELHGQTIYICATYLPPPATTKTVLEFTSHIAHRPEIYHNRVLIIGDINIREFNHESIISPRKIAC